MDPLRWPMASREMTTVSGNAWWQLRGEDGRLSLKWSKRSSVEEKQTRKILKPRSKDPDIGDGEDGREE